MIDTIVSVIIPCFNHGAYLAEAIDSIRTMIGTGEWELIIVNDGSTDSETLELFAQLEQQGFTILHQPNLGLAAARNAGLAKAIGRYIIPLDSDNQLITATFRQAVEMMDAEPDIAMIYTDFISTGERSGYETVFDGEIHRLLRRNYIDACSIIRKKVLLEKGGYDSMMPAMGNEDWELAYYLIAKQMRIVHLPKAGFYYRVRNDSMYAQQTMPNERRNMEYLFAKYPSLATNAFVDIYETLEKKCQELSFSDFRLNAFKQHLKKDRLKAAIKVLLGKPFSY